MALNYERIGWENAPSTNTPIDAGSLNHMDNGILAVSNQYDVDVPYLQEQVAGIPAMLDSYLAEEIGTDVTAWLNAHVTPGGSTIVVDDTLTISGAAADAAKCGELKNALPTKAEQDGAYPDLTAGQMLSKVETADSVPYNFRAVGHEATLEYTDAIVGGSVVANQVVQNGNFADSSNWAGNTSLSISGGIATYTASGRYDGLYQNFPVTHLKDRVYFMHTKLKTSTATDQIQFILQGAGTASSKYSASTTDWQTLEAIDKPGLDFERVTVRDNRADIHDSYQITDIYVIDLTQMFGTAIADYIYTLETTTTGTGVAWLRQHFPKLFTYQEYNAGEIVSVQGLSQHVTVGFNQWDEEWEVGGLYNASGLPWATNDRIRSKNFVKVLPNTDYASTHDFNSLCFYDENKNYITRDLPITRVFKTPQNASYLKFATYAYYGTTYNHDICINIFDSTRNGEYEPYASHTYPLDDSLTLRGIPKLDANNQLYYDGDRYLPDGTVQRRYGVRAYQSGDVTDGSTMITDGTNTVYKLTTPTTEEADPYTVPQIVDPDGTEEYVSASIVPVGHESRYPLNIAGRLDKILTMPTANGTYTLRATVNNGAVTYAWVST